MPPPSLEPIQDSDLAAFSTFLNRNLNPGIAPDAWARAFQQRWSGDKPNNGFLLRDQGEIVGGIGAIYSERRIAGKRERFCNITSWCVLEPYRAQSMRLALAVVSQKGYHFTDLTPTGVVAGSLRFLKFKAMDAIHLALPNLPWPLAGLDGMRVIGEGDAIAQALPPGAAKVYRDHRHFPWLHHVAVGRPGAYCHVVFKRGTLKKLPSAFVLGVSDAALFLRYSRRLGHHLLFRHGMVTTRIESRLLQARPGLCFALDGYRPKMFRSDTLDESTIDNLYSELAALDLS